LTPVPALYFSALETLLMRSTNAQYLLSYLLTYSDFGVYNTVALCSLVYVQPRCFRQFYDIL